MMLFTCIVNKRVENYIFAVGKTIFDKSNFPPKFLPKDTLRIRHDKMDTLMKPKIDRKSEV